MRDSYRNRQKCGLVSPTWQHDDVNYQMGNVDSWCIESNNTNNYVSLYKYRYKDK